jgi:tetratricopeptide (TPR) repeat protein
MLYAVRWIYYPLSMRKLYINKLCLVFFVIILAMAVVFARCSRRGERVDLMRDLPPRLAELLAEADDSTLALYAREVGIETFIDAKRHFEDLARNMPEQDYVRHSDSIYVLHKRVCSVLADEFYYDFYLNDLEFIYGFSPAQRQRLMVSRANIWTTAFEQDLSIEARIDSITGYYEAMVEIEDRFGAGTAKMMLSELYGADGDKKREKEYLIDAIDDFAELGIHRLTCQSLGVLGSIYEREGKIDSTELCYQAARDLAVRLQLSDQISRFTYFYACRYARMGRLALANDLFNEAIELCKTYKGGYYEIRFIFHAMDFYAEYSCWETVERLLSRAKILEGVYSSNRLSKQFMIGNAFIEARWNMAHGNVEKANTLFRRVEELKKTDPYLVDDTAHLYYWARGLLENGRADGAIEIIDRGLPNVRKKSLKRGEVRFLTLEARAEIDRGNIDRAREAVERFDAVSSELHTPLLYEWVTRHVNRARIAVSEGDTAEAISCVEDGLVCLRSFVELMDISVQGYLWINECVELRRLMHELTKQDPKLGYGAELVWRSIPLAMGTRQVEPDMSRALTMAAKGDSAQVGFSGSGGGLIDHFRETAETTISRLGESGALHCMYVVDDDQTARFTVSSEGVRRDVIPCSRRKLYELVIETQESMSGEMNVRDDEDVVDVYENLSELGRNLLPVGLRAYERPGNPRTLMITTDDFLDCIPFETFDIGTGGDYVPLIERFDVVYLCHLGANRAPPENNRQGIVIVNSGCGNTVHKRYTLGHRLEYVEEEGRTVAALDKNAIILEGSDATKREIMKRWEEASYLYFATHIIRDPEIPYLVLIPLAAPSSIQSPESCFLDFTDIRSADFSRCDVVVLSGCSSGAPSVDATSIGPSLGDAFLDGGAAVVIDTFWDVKDDEARRLMIRYAQELGTTGHAHIRSLCNARRALLDENPASRQSFDWASYAIRIGGLPE